MSAPSPASPARVDLTRDAVRAARAARLRYVRTKAPGIRRVAKDGELSYIAPDETRVEDDETLARIRALAIPPAWTEVWICPDPNGHVQATGLDAKGRKQYRYHADWRSVRDRAKYERMARFGEALPRLRARVEADLRRRRLDREQVLGTVVGLLEGTRMRIGNDQYARSNKSFGLTTLRDRHVREEGGTLRLVFRGKSGKDHAVAVRDKRLARIVRRCRDIPGQELFQYLDADGSRHTICSHDVNEYLREGCQADFTAKDFRTWAGSVLAADHLRALPPPATDREAAQYVVEAVRDVSERLGNTPAVCRKAYVHPAVVEACLDRSLWTLNSSAEGDRAEGLREDERFFLRLLQSRQQGGGLTEPRAHPPNVAG